MLFSFASDNWFASAQVSVGLLRAPLDLLLRCCVERACADRVVQNFAIMQQQFQFLAPGHPAQYFGGAASHGQPMPGAMIPQSPASMFPPLSPVQMAALAHAHAHPLACTRGCCFSCAVTAPCSVGQCKRPQAASLGHAGSIGRRRNREHRHQQRRRDRRCVGWF